MIKNFKCSGYSSDIDKNSSNTLSHSSFKNNYNNQILFDSLSNFVPLFEKHILIVWKDRCLWNSTNCQIMICIHFVYKLLGI